MPTIPNLTPDPLLPQYRFNESANRYIGPDGRFVPSSTIKGQLSNVLDSITKQIGNDTQAIRDGRLSLSEWQANMMNHIKDTHLIAGAMERGGWHNMTASDFGRIGQIVRGEYGHLRDLANGIASGDVLLDGRLLNRARMYGNDGWETYHTFARLTAAGQGYGRVRSKRNARDSCQDCFDFDGVEYAIDDPDYLPPGRRQCKSNCRCSESYIRSSTGAVRQA